MRLALFRTDADSLAFKRVPGEAPSVYACRAPTDVLLGRTSLSLALAGFRLERFAESSDFPVPPRGRLGKPSANRTCQSCKRRFRLF